MAELFVASEELVDTGNEIIKLYNKYLGRDPLQGGLDGWLATGQSIEQIEQGIANSPEAAVFQAFNETVGRDPTMEERDFYVNVNPAPIEVVEEVLSGTQEAQEFQTQQQLDQTDMLADTTADDTTVDDAADDTPAAVAKDTYTVITSNAKGDASSPFGGSAESNQTAQLVEMTEQELRQEFEDSGQLQQQFGSFDNYMGYINDSQEWVQSADWMLANPDYRPSDIESAVIQGEDRGYAPGQKEEVQQNISADRVNARQSGYQQWMNEGASILQKWGIQDTIYNEDGDQFKWTGSGYQKTVKVDDHAGVADYVKGALVSISASLVTGGVLSGPLTAAFQGAGMSSAVATAASQAITTMASQAIATGDVDVKSALISAAIGYGGKALGDFVSNSAEVDSALGSIASSANEALTKLEGFIETGIPIADAAIKAGGMSMLTQFVSTGDVSLEQAGIAALMAGGAEAIGQLAAALGNSTDEVLEEITVDAERVGTKVGDNSYLLETGDVISVDSDGKPLILGKMSDIDLDGDGLLSSSDLQNIEVTAQQVTPNVFDYKMGDTVYVDASGSPVNPDRVKFGLNGFVDSDGNLLDTKPYNEVFGGDRGGLVWNSEGGTEGTINYENGELAYTKVEGQWQDAQGNIVDDPQFIDELTLIAAKAIDTPLESITYYDQSGNPIDYKYAPYNVRDSYEAGQYSGTIFGKDGSRYEWDDSTGLYKYSPTTADPGYTQEVWYDPTTGTEYVKVEDKLTINKVDLTNVVEPVEPVVVETTDAGGSAATSQQAVTDLTESLSSSSSSESAASAVTNAAASGMSAAEIAMAVSNALSGGAISSETASAASAALEGIAGKGDVADTGVLDASGDLATDTGFSGTTVTVSTQDSGMLTGNNVNVGTGDAGANVGASNVGTSASGTATQEKSDVVKAAEWILGNLPNYSNMTEVEINNALSGAGLNPIDMNSDGTISSESQAVNNQTNNQALTLSANNTGDVTGSASGVITGVSGVDGSGVDGSGVDGSGVDGSGVDGSGVDGSGLDGSGAFDGTGVTGVTGVTGSNNVTTTTSKSTTAGTTTTPTTGPPGPGTTVTVANGKDNGKGPGEGSGEGSGEGLGGEGLNGGGKPSGMLTGREFTPLPQADIRIQAESVPEVAIQLEDPFAQLTRLAFAPHGNKPSGVALDGLLTSLTSGKSGV